MTPFDLVLRNCTTLEEFDLCVALQKEVWGFSDAELVPLRIFALAPKIGGQVVGAWVEETFVGYAMAIPGNRYGRPYLHSHMVAVKDGYRNIGLGRKLKLFQRDDAVARGYELMEWTFDPLEIKNSYFNLERLGAIAADQDQAAGHAEQARQERGPDHQDSEGGNHQRRHGDSPQILVPGLSFRRKLSYLALASVFLRVGEFAAAALSQRHQGVRGRGPQRQFCRGRP